MKMYQTFNKVISVLRSCETEDQVEVARNMYNLFWSKYNNKNTDMQTLLDFSRLFAEEASVKRSQIWSRSYGSRK